MVNPSPDKTIGMKQKKEDMGQRRSFDQKGQENSLLFNREFTLF